MIWSGKPKTTTSLVRAYGKGFWHIAILGIGMIGTVFAWRLANELYDWLKKGQPHG